MTKRKERKQAEPESVRRRVEELIRNFEFELQTEELRPKVLALVPIFHNLRELGKALIPSEYASAARDRILHYLRKYPGIVISGDELLVISGIQEYARRVRELRVQFGWAIASGVTIKEMGEDLDSEITAELKSMKPSDYVLLNEAQDRDAAHRWNVANTIRKERGSIREKLLKYLRSNVGKPITNEELRYVAGDKTEWARRVRELRTEFGWPIVTKSTGEPDLPVGVYVLQADRQSPEHDRRIPDDIRREILRVMVINAKSVVGHMMNGINRIRDTLNYIISNIMQRVVRTQKGTLPPYASYAMIKYIGYRAVKLNHDSH